MIYNLASPKKIIMPVKGDLINLDLDGNGAKQYRVLSVNGNICKVMGMFDNLTSAYNETNTNKYEGSTLDAYLNTTWYNTLTDTAKAAIVSENIVQYYYKYYDIPNTADTPTYTYQYQYQWSNSDYDNADNVGNITVGERNVFALDLKDIFDYFGKVCITSDELMTMFFDNTTAVSKYIWLRSADAVSSGSAWYVFGGNGTLSKNPCGHVRMVRPAFQIDLSKVDWS